MGGGDARGAGVEASLTDSSELLESWRLGVGGECGRAAAWRCGTRRRCLGLRLVGVGEHCDVRRRFSCWWRLGMSRSLGCRIVLGRASHVWRASQA